MTAERRKHTRKKVDKLLELRDINHESILGRIVDISNDGVMLLSNEPIPTNKVWQLGLELPQGSDSIQAVEFGAESLWCDIALQPGQYWSGFHIIDISQEARESIDQFVSDYQ